VKTRPRIARPKRAGFTLIETMFGMSLLAISITTVAALDVKMMQTTRGVARASYTNATLLREVNRYVALPFDSLATLAGCDTVATPVPHTACATVTSVTTMVSRVTVVVTPSAAGARPDTVVIDRSSRSANSPVNTP
jgi:prepilin-type N-terminal cleavage/methylation domain-containing protein